MKTDRVIVLCILCLAAIYWFAIGQIREPLVGDPIGPRAIPKLLAIGLVISALLLWVETISKKKSRESSAKIEPGSAQEAGSRPVVIAAIVGGTLVYFFLFSWLGYALATAAYLFVLMSLFNPAKTTANALTALGFSLGSYLAFTRLFGAQLPAGLLPF
jgi:putative tricarboxylic transport membrane protein